MSGEDPVSLVMRTVGRVMDRKYPQSDVRPLVCEDCGKRFTTWESYAAHVVFHGRGGKQ